MIIYVINILSVYPSKALIFKNLALAKLTAATRQLVSNFREKSIISKFYNSLSISLIASHFWKVAVKVTPFVIRPQHPYSFLLNHEMNLIYHFITIKWTAYKIPSSLSSDSTLRIIIAQNLYILRNIILIYK